MHQRKGTLAAVNKLLDLSGVTSTVVELYSQWIPWRCNRHKTYDPTQDVIESHYDPFANVNDWDTPLAGTWNVVSYELVGQGGGSDSATNCVLRDDDRTDFFTSVEFEITGGFGSGAEFGMYLDYSSTSKFVRLEARTVGSVDSLYLVMNDNGILTEREVGDISSLDHHSGEHVLWCHCDLDAGWYCVGMDTTAFARQGSIRPSYALGEKKGLWVNDSLEVTFDEYRVKRFQIDLTPHLVDAFSNNRQLLVTLVSAIDNEADRYRYVRRVLPTMVPADVKIDWPLVVTDVATLVCASVAPTFTDVKFVTPAAPQTLVCAKVDPTVILGSITITPSPGTIRVSSVTPLVWSPFPLNYVIPMGDAAEIVPEAAGPLVVIS
jgi:hypothetical protein